MPVRFSLITDFQRAECKHRALWGTAQATENQWPHRLGGGTHFLLTFNGQSVSIALSLPRFA